VKSEFPIPKWTEKHDIISFSVTSDGTTGEEWITRLEGKGFRIGDYAKSILCSKSFKPTTGITYEIAILKGKIFSDSKRVTKNIRKEAKNRMLSTPKTEVACLIREKFSDKEIEAMGLFWIVTMHESIEDPDGNPSLLLASRNGSGSWLGREYDDSDLWHHGYGFAFVVSH